MTKRGFTLVELLVVVGIMASMATLSIGSYFAVVRGMADRGAIATATSAIALAQERACIDLVPTVVYFYNEIVQREDEEEGDEEVVVGVALAVRRAGRISNVNGNVIGDEFADLDRIYGAVDNEGDLNGGDTFRLYRFNVSKMEYSSVYSTVAEYPIGVNPDDDFLVEGPIGTWSEKFDKDPDYADDTENVNELLSFGFKIAGGFSGWKVGDSYAYEFVRVQLPDNYIFGTGGGDAPTDGTRVKMLDSLTILCKPDRASDEAALEESVSIVCKAPNGKWRNVGKTKKEMKDI